MENYLGNKLKNWCLDTFGTLANAADKLDIQYPALARYLKGEVMPGAPFLIKCLKLGCNINWLLIEDYDIEAQLKADFEINYLRSQNTELRRKIDRLTELIKELNKVIYK